MKQTELTRGLNTLHSHPLRPSGVGSRFGARRHGVYRALELVDHFRQHYTHRGRVYLRDVKARSYKRRCEHCQEIIHIFVYRMNPYMVGCYHGTDKEFKTVPGFKYGRIYRLTWSLVTFWLKDRKLTDLLLLAGTDPVDLEVAVVEG